jgi:hypothetical protein
MKGRDAGGRLDGPAAGLPVGVTLCLLVAGSAIRLPAQTSLHLSLGARYSSTLVHDSIVTPLDVRPAIGPALDAALGLPLSGPWRLELLADLSTASLRRYENGATIPVTRLWILGAAVGLRKPVDPWLEMRGAIGGLKYLSTSTTGLFSAGTGGVMPYASLTVDAVPPPLARRGLALELGGDVHRFLTPGLRTSGFTDPRLVYRLTLGVRADLRRLP